MLAIDRLAPIKTFIAKTKPSPPWITTELAQLYNKHDALRRRYNRTQNNNLRQQYLHLAFHANHLTEQSRSEYLHSRISDALEGKKNIWKELRSLGLMPTKKDDLHGFTPNELNTHFLLAGCRRRWHSSKHRAKSTPNYRYHTNQNIQRIIIHRHLPKLLEESSPGAAKKDRCTVFGHRFSSYAFSQKSWRRLFTPKSQII